MASEDRLQAKPTYSAEMIIVGAHTRLDVAIGGDFITKPLTATHVDLQALTQNIRYTIDGTQASATIGFQLADGAKVTLSVSSNGVSVFEEAAGAIVQYQWLR